MRCRGAKSFVDDLGLSRGVVLSRAVHFCDLLRLSPLTRRFVRFRRTRLHIFRFHFDAVIAGANNVLPDLKPSVGANESIARVDQSDLRRTNASTVWTQPDNLHLGFALRVTGYG